MGRPRLLQDRPLEDEQAAAAISFEPHEALALTGTQQIDQAGEPVAALVETTIGCAQQLLDIAQVYRPPRGRRGRQNLPDKPDAISLVTRGRDGCRRDDRCLDGLRLGRRRSNDFPPRLRRSLGIGRRRRRLIAFLELLIQFDHHAPASVLQLRESGLSQLFDEVVERGRTVVAFGEGRVELEQGALQEPRLWRHFAVGQDLQRAAHDRERLRDRAAGCGRHRATTLERGATATREVLVGDELVAVALQDNAREGAAAHDEDLLVVLLQLLDQREEVAVAAHDHVCVDVRVRERHFEGVEGEVDVRSVFVAAGRQIALHQPDGVLREMPAVLARARPVGIGDLGDHLTPLLQGVEDSADVEILSERRFDADFDVVEVDEDGDVETVLMGQLKSFQLFILILCREGRRRLSGRDDHPRELAMLHDLAYG